MAKGNNTLKTGLVSAAVGVGIGAAAVALSDKNNRKKAAKAIKGISKETVTRASDIGAKTQKTMQELSKKAVKLKNGKQVGQKVKSAKKTVNKVSPKVLHA